MFDGSDWHQTNVLTHIIAGALGLLVGLIPMFSTKGGGRHRVFGRLFIAIAVVTIATALVGIVFFDPPTPLIAATLTAGYQFVGSVRALQLRHSGPRLFDALLAVACLGACALLVADMSSASRSWSPAIGYSTAGYLACVATYDLSRRLWKRAWLEHARLYDHGLKMTGAYFAMASAGVGNVLRDFQPFSQVAPSAIGVFVAIALAVAFARRGVRENLT